MTLVKCEKCEKEFYTDTPDEGCPFCESKSTTPVQKNTVASVSKIIGWLTIIIGIIGGLIYGQVNIGLMITVWLGSGVSAVVFFALAEIIQILHDIRARIYKK